MDVPIRQTGQHGERTPQDPSCLDPRFSPDKVRWALLEVLQEDKTAESVLSYLRRYLSYTEEQGIRPFENLDDQLACAIVGIDERAIVRTPHGRRDLAVNQFLRVVLDAQAQSESIDLAMAFVVGLNSKAPNPVTVSLALEYFERRTNLPVEFAPVFRAARTQYPADTIRCPRYIQTSPLDASPDATPTLQNEFSRLREWHLYPVTTMESDAERNERTALETVLIKIADSDPDTVESSWKAVDRLPQAKPIFAYIFGREEARNRFSEMPGYERRMKAISCSKDFGIVPVLGHMLYREFPRIPHRNSLARIGRGIVQFYPQVALPVLNHFLLRGVGVDSVNDANNFVSTFANLLNRNASYEATSQVVDELLNKLFEIPIGIQGSGSRPARRRGRDENLEKARILLDVLKSAGTFADRVGERIVAEQGKIVTDARRGDVRRDRSTRQYLRYISATLRELADDFSPDTWLKLRRALTRHQRQCRSEFLRSEVGRLQTALTGLSTLTSQLERSLRSEPPHYEAIVETVQLLGTSSSQHLLPDSTQELSDIVGQVVQLRQSSDEETDVFGQLREYLEPETRLSLVRTVRRLAQAG